MGGDPLTKRGGLSGGVPLMTTGLGRKGLLGLQAHTVLAAAARCTLPSLGRGMPTMAVVGAVTTTTTAVHTLI